MDQQTGRVLNADMEFYKLSGIGDIGEILVHMDITPEHDARGIIGLGEPPAIAGMAAISNAVANAIGVRVGTLPLTPARVLAALGTREERINGTLRIRQPNHGEGRDGAPRRDTGTTHKSSPAAPTSSA